MSTLEATTLAVAAVVVLVALIAVVLAWRTTGRGRAGVAVQPEPDVPPGAASVLEALRSSALLVGTDDVVRTASAQVYSMGLVSGGRLVPSQLVEMVAGVRRDGQIREAELVLPHVRSQSRYVLARVAPLSPRIVLVLLEDRTHERHVEMVRRDFVANVSHELKTPVGALRLLAEAVKEAADDPEAVVRFAGRMQHESVRLDRLVQQIIELSRLQGDERVEEPVVVEVADVISVAVQGSRTAAEAKAMSLRMHVDPGLEVLGDPDQLEAAIGNLVENAVTYGREASRVAVVARTVGEQVQIAVSDQGVGIAQSELERIFERFYRVDPARARATGGTGLGLSIVKHVAASHGGDITVWSEPGQGSTFTLCLPAYRGHGRGSGSSGGRGADATAEPARDELDPPASRAALRGEPASGSSVAPAGRTTTREAGP